MEAAGLASDRRSANVRESDRQLMADNEIDILAMGMNLVALGSNSDATYASRGLVDL